jgi:hypothetical protein
LRLDVGFLNDFRHFSRSARITAANSCGVLPTGSEPSSSSFAFTSGVRTIFTNSALRRDTICADVPAGANTPK